MGAIAWLLLGVYQIGYTIEDPFQGTLRLQVLCDAVYRDVMYTPSEKSSPRETAFELNEERKEWAILDGFDAYLVGAAP
jgi:predicted membrane chloride channel (bestrophin family)